MPIEIEEPRALSSEDLRRGSISGVDRRGVLPVSTGLAFDSVVSSQVDAVRESVRGRR